MRLIYCGVTQLLNRWVEGDAAALDQVTSLVYAQLRQIVRQIFRRERESHTLQPTALVHEAFIRLLGVQVECRAARTSLRLRRA